MGNLIRLLFIFLSMALILSTQVASAAEDVYLEGEKGHFTVEPGKVYHWTWTGVEQAPEKTGLPERAEPPAPKEAAPPAKEAAPEAMENKTQEATVEATSITRDAIAMMMSEISEAANKKDIDSIARYLAPDVIVFLTIDAPSGRQDLRLNKEEYLKKVKQGFSNTPAYSYKSENVEINISRDGKSATIDEDIRETVGTMEMKTDVVSHQKSALELRDGQILVTKIVATEK